MLTVNKANASTTDWGNMPLSDLSYGCSMDCDFTHRMVSDICADMEDEGVTGVYDKVLSDVIIKFALLESKGIRVNTKQLDIAEKVLFEEISRIEKKLEDMSPVKGVSLTKPSDLMGVLFTSQGYDIEPIEWNKVSKSPKMDRETLEKTVTNIHSRKKSTDLHKQGANYIELYLLWKKRYKQYNDYVKNLRKALDFNGDGRIYSQYNFSVCKTGRLSNSAYRITRREVSEKGRIVAKKHSKGVSFHTLPRPDDEEDNVGDVAVNLRRIMGCEPGNVFLCADYSAAEVRVMAHCSGDVNLINAFKSGVDLHKYTASLIFGKSIDKVTPFERTTAKSVTFLILYGGGPTKLAGKIKKSLSYCKGIFASYFKAFPGVKEWIVDTREQIEIDGYATSLFGRKRRLLNVKSPVKKYRERALRQGINFIIQSSASDLMLHAIWRITTMAEKYNIDIDLIATVHDSLEAEAPKESFQKAASLMKYCMTDTSYIKYLYGWEFKVPFEVDMECGDSFGSGVDSEFDNKFKLLNSEEVIEYVEQAA